ncbi:MAG: glycosyltransferase family 39 protein, partial [Bacteroidota bacterium]
MGNQFSKTFSLFLGILLLLNLLQAYFTPLIYDETYYWYYSQNMAWGYFDHPPMVALLAKIGGLIFSGELGVRFIGCLLGTGTLMILWLLIDQKKKDGHVPLFFLLVFSMVLFNAYGFFTLPDTPLLFFTALFLWLYKRFLEKNTIVLALLLGLCMAALLYSKYHAVLVILFVVLSNIKLVRNKHAWLAVLVAVTAYTPHFIWLFQNDFISVKYHLFERPNQPYEFDEFTLGYLLNLLVNFGLLFPWFYWALFKTKARDKFNRSLIFVSYGIILFFFLSSFHRRAQAQWVIAICIPMVLLTFNYLLTHKASKQWLWRIGIASTVLIFYARAWLMYHPLIPFMGYETHGPKEWVQTLNEIVGDTPVVFENSYRRAPMYSFYSGNPAFSLNNIHYRQNQYTIDTSEHTFQNKRVAYVTPYANSGEFSYVPFRSNQYFGWYIDDFESFRKLRCFLNNEPVDLSAKQHTLKIYNPYDKDISLDKLKFKMAYLDTYKDILEIRSTSIKPIDTNSTFLKAKDTTRFNFTFPKPIKMHPNFIKFSISENGLASGINSPSIK